MEKIAEHVHQNPITAFVGHCTTGDHPAISLAMLEAGEVYCFYIIIVLCFDGFLVLADPWFLGVCDRGRHLASKVSGSPSTV